MSYGPDLACKQPGCGRYSGGRDYCDECEARRLPRSERRRRDREIAKELKRGQATPARALRRGRAG